MTDAAVFGLQDIRIVVNDADDSEQEVTANVRALLTEIATLLNDYLSTGTSSSIDLRSLPLLPGEYESIKTILGKGEVQATIDTLGVTSIYETVLSGVWWVAHDNETESRIAETIEITAMPDILKSQPADIAAAHTALRAQLADWD